MRGMREKILLPAQENTRNLFFMISNLFRFRGTINFNCRMKEKAFDAPREIYERKDITKKI